MCLPHQPVPCPLCRQLVLIIQSCFQPDQQTQLLYDRIVLYNRRMDHASRTVSIDTKVGNLYVIFFVVVDGMVS